MASLGKGILFVVEPSGDHLCPICTEPLMEPYLTDCGHYLCYTCRGRLLASGTVQCPECREPNALKDARLNKHLQRQVNSFKVHCQHHQVGCEWVGELRYLQQHLDPETRRCGYILLPCPLGCGELIRSYLKQEHMMNDCLKRSCVCEHCGYYNKRDIVTEMHYPLCDLFPVECPNKCSVQNLKRIQFEMHLKQCPLQVIECPFSSAGCAVQLPRKEMEAHEDMAMRQHLHMVMSLLQSKPTQEPSSPSPSTNHSHYRFSLPPVEFTIMNFLKMKESDGEWISPPFYTHPHGYKLCLVVYPNGVYFGKGTHVSVFVGLMKGEHDDQLNWPVEVGVAVELLNWKKDKKHHEETLTMNSEYYRVTQKGGIKLSPTNMKFICHSLLSLNTTANTEYLQDDCLWLRVCTATINYTPGTPLHVKTPSWEDSHNVSQSVYEFTMPEFSKRKEFNNTCYSPPFYTHQCGYKLCLRVHANGDCFAKDTHISVYVQLMAGDNDDQLQWPFVGDIVLELLNWRKNMGHYQITVSIDDARKFYQVTEGTVGMSLGIARFLPHSSLSYNSTTCTNTHYLQNDCLRLRVSKVAMYPPLYPIKVPSWQQDPHNVQSQSVCEFTLSQFSKRKESNNLFFSPPFYTHQHGYKLSIGIYSNGRGDGKNTHISVYVCLMAGEYDHQLQWPFIGDVVIELLNWKENKNHHQMTVSVKQTSGFVRIFDRVYGTLQGYSRFISYSSLSYNSTTNTEYLQDDCLRFKSIHDQVTDQIITNVCTPSFYTYTCIN